jgi:calcineurin-like phosphoesterase family protein
MTLWFTADTHFGHQKIIEFAHRPYASVEEMDEHIIDHWNRTVGPKDEVWHLGDVAFKAKPVPYLRRLNGKIRIIVGNHDVPSQFGISYEWYDVHYLRHQGQRLWLSHYAHRVWRNSHHGSFHLYGHSHGDLEPKIWGRSMDVGWDAHRRLLSFDEIISTLSTYGPTVNHDR